MGFKYINPGIYPESNAYVVRTTSSTYTQTGHAFSTNQTYNNSYSKLVLLTLDEYYEEVYGKFDFFLPMLSTTQNAFLYFDVTDGDLPRSTFGITSSYNSKNKTRSSSINFTSYENNSITTIISIMLNATLNTKHTMYFHIANNATCQIYLDGSLKVDRTDETHSSTNTLTRCPYFYFNRIRVDTVGSFYMSNFIISDSRITPNETMIEVPISSTSTNMTESSGVYTASSVGKYILQTPNKSSLVSSYPNHRVTGISTVAQPAYTNGTPTTIAGRESSLKHDSTVLTTSNVAGALSSWKANLAMSQIDSKQYGWEVIA